MKQKPQNFTSIQVALQPQQVATTIIQAADIFDAKVEESEAENGYVLITQKNKWGGLVCAAVYAVAEESGSRVDVAPMLKIPLKGFMDPEDYFVKPTPQQIQKVQSQAEQLVRNCLAQAGTNINDARMTKSLRVQDQQLQKMRKEVRSIRGCMGCMWWTSCFLLGIGLGVAWMLSQIVDGW